MPVQFDPGLYDRPVDDPSGSLPLPVEIVESEVDLYYHIAVSMLRRVRENNANGVRTVFIVPVGPTFQYRRFVRLCREIPTDLSALHLFFMDEYLTPDGAWIDEASPLSFRGFVRRELVSPMPEVCNLQPSNIHFPDPADPAAIDRQLLERGGADICFAGVGINGHLAFNEPPAPPDSPSRVVALTRETITINSNTALGGAFDQIPARAVTIGMRSILASVHVHVYLNRPWQSAVLRKLLFGPVSEEFPASLLRTHRNVTLTVTPEVARKPDFGLR